MSSEDLSVGLPTEEPLGDTMHPPHPPTTLPTNTTTPHSNTPATNTPTPPLPSYAYIAQPSTLYSKTPLPHLSPSSIRIMFSNVNALPVEDTALLAKTIYDYMQYDPTIIGLIETKRNFYLADRTTTPLRNMVQSILDSPAKIKLVTASCREEHSASKLKEPGGVCQLTLGRILNLHKQNGSDNLGRWAWQQFRLDGIRSLYVITAYRVCPKPPTSSKHSTAWHQQYRGLQRQGVKNPDPRQRFIHDLRSFLNDIKSAGAEYIVGWDANTPHNDDEILYFLTETDMVDAFDDYLTERPNTHKNGSKQIDLISTSRGLASHITNAFILDPNIGEGDHSYVGIDLDLASLTSRTDLIDIDPGHRQHRILVSTDVKASSSYLTRIKKKNNGHNLTERLQVLYQRCDTSGLCSDSDRRQFQRISERLYANAKQAEQECKRVGRRPWSRMMAAAGKVVQYANDEFASWKNHESRHPTDNNPAAFARAKHNREIAYAELRRIYAQGELIRETDRQLHAQEEAAKQNTSKANIIKSILRRERDASIYPLLRHWIKGKSSSVDEVWTPDDPLDLDNTTWTAIVEKEAIFEALIHHGRKHFSQATNTPFVSGPIADLIGPFEFNQSSQDILNGNFDIDAITDDLELRDIVKAMAHSDPSNPINAASELTIDKLRTGFSFIKESTASNPDGLHHGHWKTLIKDEDAFEPYALMIMFAFKFSEPPDAWTNAQQVMLGKDPPGQPIRINRIRRIQLVCAAMNMGFRIIWGHEMMQMATKHGLISPYQFGARNGHMAISCVLLKRTSYDIIRLMRLTACIFDNDATACYDRMIPSQCMMVSARSGVNTNAIHLKLRVLARMKYFVKTAYGISSTFFTHSHLRKILGLLQGSADAGAIWSLNWSLLFNVLDMRFPKARLPSPRPHIFTERNGEGFVDDTALLETSDSDPITTVTAQTERKAQTWERLIHVSGGGLNLIKNFWYAISWHWRKNGQPMMQMKKDNPDLEIRLTQGHNRDYSQPVPRIEVNDGKRTLGIRLNPLGVDNTEYSYRVDEATKTRSRLLHAPLNREHTRIGFMSMILTKFSWPLGATCFSEKQCDGIQSKFMGTVLSKMGINKNTKFAVRTGPTLYSGMEVPSLWPIQGASKNKLLIGHLRKNDIVGNNLKVELDCLQLQAGTSWNVLSRDGRLVRNYVDHCWSSHLWEVNDNYGLTIRREDKPWLLPQREHDKFIMEALSQLPTAKKSQIRMSQCTRLYLGVTTLADVTNSAGTHLAEWVTNPKYVHPSRSPSTIKYPNQTRPNSTVWNTFVLLLRLAFTEGTNDKLCQPLGNWLRGRISQCWNQVFCPSDGFIYSFETSPCLAMHIYERARQSRRFRYARRSTTLSFPLDIVPVSGQFQNGYFLPDTPTMTADIIDPPNDDASPWLRNMLHNYNHWVPLPELADAIWRGDAYIGSDGSAANDHGTYSFIILIHLQSSEPTLALTCGGNMPDIAEFLEMDSHRPESAGLFAALCFVRRLLQEHPRGPLMGDLPPLRCCLDNKSVAVNDIDWTFDSVNSPVFDFLKADYDILQGILQVIDDIPLTTTIRWVKGHQDRDGTARSDLSIPAQANCHADDVCTATHSQHPHQVGRFPDWIPGTMACLLHNGKLVTKKVDEYVRTAATAPALREHIINKSHRRDKFIPNDWSDATFDDVDWRAVRSSLKAVSIGRRFQLSKFAHEWTPTLHHLATINNSVDRRCFACQHQRNYVKEDIDHVLRCTSNRRSHARMQALTTFRNHLAAYHTPAPMANSIMTALERWFQDLPPDLTPRLPTGEHEPNRSLHQAINDAFHHQSSIGWGHFLRGRISKHWKHCIALYYQERQPPGDKFTPILWSRKTVDAIWQIFLTIWTCRNGEKYGKDYDEQREIALATSRDEVRRIYEQTRASVNDQESALLHSLPLETILNWTKSHLDAYLATAEVILEQNVDPG